MFARIFIYAMSRNRQEFTSLVFEALPHAVLIVDADGRILSRNAAARAMLPAGEKVDQVLVAGPGASFAWRDELAALAELPRGLVRRSLPLAGTENRRLLVDIHLAQLAGTGGDGRRAVLVVVEDVSARASMERRLAASERLGAAGELAGKVGHELNNPLDGVLRYIGLAERICGAKAAEYLGKARTGLVRMSDIVRQLTDEGADWRSGGRRQPIGKLLDEAIAVMDPRAAAAGVSVVCDADDALAEVPGSIFQVFCNVIKNALDAMPTGGVLNIRLRCDGKQCVAEFADTGCGVPDGRAEMVFQPFYSTKPAGEGAGLGLTICREILSRLGGAVTLANRPEGGAVATVIVPLRDRQTHPEE